MGDAVSLVQVSVLSFTQIQITEHHLLKGHEFEQTLRVSEGRKAWRAAVHGAAKSQIRLSD